MKGAVAEMDRKMREDDSYFANVYRYTFVFNLQEGQRILSGWYIRRDNKRDND